MELTPAELAARWGMAVRSLANWRSSGRGPDFVKTPGKRESIRYPLPAVLEYERERSRDP